jgi:hypothetical protein
VTSKKLGLPLGPRKKLLRAIAVNYGAERLIDGIAKKYGIGY